MALTTKPLRAYMEARRSKILYDPLIWVVEAEKVAAAMFSIASGSIPVSVIS